VSKISVSLLLGNMTAVYTPLSIYCETAHNAIMRTLPNPQPAQSAYSNIGVLFLLYVLPFWLSFHDSAYVRGWLLSLLMTHLTFLAQQNINLKLGSF